jgi:multiple sugar transport system substrate-binding protein
MKDPRSQLTRRNFLKASALTAGTLVLAACTPAGQPGTVAPAGSAPAAAQQKQLRLSAWADVQDAVVYENMVNRWHETQDEYRVTVEQYPGGYYEKIQANFAAGNSADVLYYQGWQWQAYAENAVLTPLDGYIERDDFGSKFPDTDNYRNNTQWRGETYMTPTDVGALVIYYNKDIFDKRGIPHPQAGWKWEEFQGIIQQLSFVEGDTRYYGWAQAGGWNGAYGRNVNFMRRNGYVEWDQVVEPRQANWIHEDVISALQFLICDAIANQWSPGPEVIAGGGVGVDTDRVAMVLEGPWYMPRLWGDLATTEAGINFDVVEPPIGDLDQNLSFGHVHGHAITAQSAEPDGSWDLIKFVLSDEGQEIIANGGRMCGTPDNIEKIWGPIASDSYSFENVEAFSNGMRAGSTPLIMGEGSQIHAYGGGPITSMWDAMLGLQKTAEEAVTDANAEIQRVLDEYWRDRD